MHTRCIEYCEGNALCTRVCTLQEHLQAALHGKAPALALLFSSVAILINTEDGMPLKTAARAATALHELGATPAACWTLYQVRR